MSNTHSIRQQVGIVSIVLAGLSALCWFALPLQATPLLQLAPPAIYYGPINAGTGFTPAVGMTVTAYINGNACGQSQTLFYNSQVVYVIEVLADAPFGTGCGVVGRTVLFYVAMQVMTPTARWDNSQTWNLPLSPQLPPAVAFNASTYTVAENASTALVTVTLSAPSVLTITVAYASTNGTALAGSDYTNANGTLTFTPAQTSQTFNLTIIADTLNEGNETVLLTLSNPSNATLGTTANATLTLLDDDAAPTVQFSASSYSVNEGAGTAPITVTLSAVSGQTVLVTYATSNLTALAGSDYTNANGTLTFTPAQTSQTFNLTIIADTLNEGNETVLLTLSNPSNATLGTTANATLTIVDDDTLRYVFLPLVVR